MSIRIQLPYLTILAVFIYLSPLQTLQASEGGGSGYTPGTYGDFAVNIVFSGLTVRENIFYFYGELCKFPTLLDPTIAIEADLKLSAWVNLIQIVWSPEDFRPLGARYFTNINIPYGFDAGLTGTAFGVTEKDNTDGIGDIQVAPLGLVWDHGYFHYSLTENIIMPSGEYNADHLANMGRNYWASETVLGLTWLNETLGHEISFSACYISNNENDDTNYKTGDEVHFDYTLAQFFSEKFAVGIVGYIYQQVTDDSGDGYDALTKALGKDLDGYKGKGSGIGPAIMWSPKVKGKPLNLVTKWIHEYEGKNRFQGGLVFVSATTTF